MSLSFFRALNPISDKSGITYCLAGYHPCQGREMIDISVWQGIYNAFNDDYYLITALSETYNIILGEHFDLSLRGRYTSHGGAKGLLDFLIFPLIARKLIANYFLPENKDNYFLKFVTIFIGFPLELSRILLSVGLMIAITPVVALIHWIKIGFSSSEERNRIRQVNESLSITRFMPQAPNLPPIPEIKPGANYEKIKDLDLEIPDEYLCPLSLEIMTDPVYVENYPMHKFERAWIEGHLTQHAFNPLNRQPLALADLKPDTILRKRIDDYAEEQLQNKNQVSP